MLQLLDTFKHDRVLALDTETTGLEETDRPFGFSISNGFTAYFFDSRTIPNLWQRSRPFLTDPNKVWVMQNPKFDMRMLSYMDCLPQGKVYDLAGMARLVRNDFMAYGLADQAARYKMQKGTEVEKHIKEYKLFEERVDIFGDKSRVPKFDKVPLDVISRYAAHDALITAKLFGHYRSALGTDEMQIVERDAHLTQVCYRMERMGVRLDTTYTTQALYKEEAAAKKARDEYKEYTGYDFVDSAKSVQKHVSTLLPTTEKGNPSLNDDSLNLLALSPNERDREIALRIRTIRDADKRVSTYYKNYLRLVGKDGRIHPSMWPHGTRTGRFSYSDPNLQNLHADKKSDAEFVVRGCFIPSPGNVFLSFDYSQMEYRMMAAYANEKKIISDLMAGADFHQATADLVGIERDVAKTLSFAILYGAGDRQVAGMLGIDNQEARRLRYKYFMGMPNVEHLIADIIAKGKSKGYVTNWKGRKLYADHEFAYALPNHLIQSGGADVVKDAMVRISAELPDIGMCLQVHDELVFDCPKELATPANIERIKQIMESAWPEKNGLRLTASAAISEKSLAKRDFREIE